MKIPRNGEGQVSLSITRDVFTKEPHHVEKPPMGALPCSYRGGQHEGKFTCPNVVEKMALTQADESELGPSSLKTPPFLFRWSKLRGTAGLSPWAMDKPKE
jgi:hypothetical protein